VNEILVVFFSVNEILVVFFSVNEVSVVFFGYWFTASWSRKCDTKWIFLSMTVICWFLFIS